LLYCLSSRQFDVETAFLYGELEEEIYMEFPDGYEKDLKEKTNLKKTQIWLLLKSIFVLVQAARQWWKRFKSALSKLGYKNSRADPCLFFLKTKEGLTLIIIYVNDGGCIGNKEIIKSTLSELAKEVMFVKNLLDYMSLNLEYPIIIEVDNAGAIYLANNHTTSQRT
jgi:hypothetical protein